MTQASIEQASSSERSLTTGLFTQAAHRLKFLSKNLVYRLMRPGMRDCNEALARVERRLDEGADLSVVTWSGGVSGKATGLEGRENPFATKKYREELRFWQDLVGGGAADRYGSDFVTLFGRWQRARVQELREILGFDECEFDMWCKQRVAVEIGPGPFPAVAVAPWRVAIAVDPLADGYQAENLVPADCDRVVFLTATAERVPLPSGMADIVVMENCLDHVSNPDRALQEAYRLLKADGLLWLLVDLMTYSDEQHPNPFTEESLHRMLRREGFVSIRERVSTDNKSHPEAYGEYRGLLKKSGEA